MSPKPEMIISFLAASDDGKDSTNWESGGSSSSGSQHFIIMCKCFLLLPGCSKSCVAHANGHGDWLLPYGSIWSFLDFLHSWDSEKICFKNKKILYWVFFSLGYLRVSPQVWVFSLLTFWLWSLEYYFHLYHVPVASEAWTCNPGIEKCFRKTD